MKKLAGLLLGLALTVSPALAQKVTIDYAHDFNFEKVKTFQYVDTKKSDAPNELMDGRIRDGIIKQLEAGGLKEVDSDPDVFVTYHFTATQDTVYDTTAFGYGGLGVGWGGWGGAAATTMSTTFTEGTIIVDAYDATDKKMVWRGTGTVTVKEKPDKQIEQIQQILSKMGTKWQKILASQGK